MKLKGMFASWEKAALALVAFLVVVPSVVNALNDIWVAVQDLPVGNHQKINAAMFQRHFQESPAASERIDVESDFGSTAISIDVYKNGDIFVNYGRFSQWFPFREIEKENVAISFSLFNAARAEEDSKVTQKSWVSENEGSHVKYRIISPTRVERIAKLKGGITEKSIIDMHTGEVISTDVSVDPELIDETQLQNHQDKALILDVRTKKPSLKQDVYESLKKAEKEEERKE